MAKKTKKHWTPKDAMPGEFEADHAGAGCIFCGGPALYWAEFECGDLNHGHGRWSACKACARILAVSSGGAYQFFPKTYDGHKKLARERADALNAVEQLLAENKLRLEGHENPGHWRNGSNVPPHRAPQHYHE